MGAMDYKGNVYSIEKVLAANEEDDLAILKLRNAELTPMALGKPANVGSDVWVISHPDRKMYMMTKGMVSRYNMIMDKNRKPGSQDVYNRRLCQRLKRCTCIQPKGSGRRCGFIHQFYLLQCRKRKERKPANGRQKLYPC